MATIGVTRGLGDHDLKVYSSNIYIKPFLSCVPEVQVYNFDDNKHGPDDVLVMGSDGLWDVTTDKEVADAVSAYLATVWQVSLTGFKIGSDRDLPHESLDLFLTNHAAKGYYDHH
uniref:PPM-type phosphatase domain-containing protein n=1 Tax=Hippocampus comes TaxID=109280 RepID=A0A3Q2XRI2_HIPCM